MMQTRLTALETHYAFVKWMHSEDTKTSTQNPSRPQSETIDAV